MGQEASHELIDDNIPPRTLRSRTIESVAELIKDGEAPQIVVLTGAGVSTSAGIPDFRSPKTGLYANLARLNLPYAEAVFDISYFRQNPNPFYALARELYPGKYKPTVAHAFVTLLAKKGFLHMLFTQNIDCLERAAGVPPEKIVEAHGSFATQRCIECRTAFPDDLMLSAVQSGNVPHCLVPQCNGLVKPDIVFFGEALPDSFRQNSPKIAQAKLVIIMGTSLTVQPFASLPDFAPGGVPRVLINLGRVGGLGSRPDDVCILSECDEGVRNLADALGWREELEALWKEVSGQNADEKIAEALPDIRTKDEKLEDEIESLTREVDHTLKISNSHKKYLEDHLDRKIDKGPSDTASKSPTAGAKDQVETGEQAPIAVGDQIDQERVGVTKGDTTESMKSVDDPPTPTPIQTTTEKDPIDIKESTTDPVASLDFNRKYPPITKANGPPTTDTTDDTVPHL